MPNDMVPAHRRAPLAVPELPPVDVVAACLAGRNLRTFRAYAKDLADFARAVGQPNANAAVELLLSLPHGQANALALGYRAQMSDRKPKLSSATIARRLSALRSVVKLARTLGRITWALDVESPKVATYRDTTGPGQAGWREMLSDARFEAEKSAKGRRDLAIIRMLHDLALRRGELVALDLADVNLEEETIAVIGKGQTDAQRMTLPPQTLDALTDWITARGVWDGPLFVRLDRAAKKPTRLTDTAVYLIVRDLGQRIGLKRPTRPHGLRHQAITRALEVTGGDVPAAMKFSRYADPRMLMIYDDRRKDVAGDIALLVAAE